MRDQQLYRDRLHDDGEKQADCEARTAWLDGNAKTATEILEPLKKLERDRCQARMTETVRNEYAIAVNGCQRPYFSDTLRKVKEARLAEIWREWLGQPAHTWRDFQSTISLIKQV